MASEPFSTGNPHPDASAATDPETESAPSLSVAVAVAVSDTDLRIGKLAVELGRAARVAKMQDVAAADALEDAAVNLAAARTSMATVLARLERATDGIAECTRVLTRRAHTNVGLRELATAIIALSQDLAPTAAATAIPDLTPIEPSNES